MTSRFARLICISALLAGCSGPTPDTGEQPGTSTLFPFDGEAQGKEDAFGRSLVGIPRHYVPDPEILADQAAADENMRTDMSLRRQVAWETARKVLEPVPLLGLENQINALPDCPAGVETRDIDQCGRQSDEASCTSFASGGQTICGWTEGVCAPTCDNLTLPDGQDIPEIPRWATWYGVEDINTMFKFAYSGLTAEDKVTRRPFSEEEIGIAFHASHTAVDRSRRWPLRRYTDAIGELFGCSVERDDGESDDEYADRCARARQSQFSGGSPAGGGIARLMYSPAMVLHMMRNYGEVLDCRDDKLQDTWCGEDETCEDPPENFSTCFKTEFPADAGNPWAEFDPSSNPDVAGLPPVGGTVVIKATWSRVGFDFELPVFDTDAATLQETIGEGKLALWPEEGHRQYTSTTGDSTEFPTPDDIYTIQTRAGSKYRLTGLHIMTKELRHWMWITLWWSDEPATDFGADRPDTFGSLPGVWSNYKMCVVTDYTEGDSNPGDGFGEFPTLQAALSATSQPGGPTWCSNPYIEHAAGNARTNCIGCHQHAGTRFAEGEPDRGFDLDAVITDDSTSVDATTRFPFNGRTRRRTHFATDYSWAFSRLDDLTELIRSEVEFDGAQDEQWVRVNDLLNAEGDATAGEEVFRNTTADQTCTECHGDSGEGGFGPPLEQRFASRTDWQLMSTILYGRDPMPAWGESLDDQQLADLFAYLKTTFDTEQ